MLKNISWKKLFTRKRSKSRSKNEVNTKVCNLCGGMPLTDVNSLCDDHRQQVAADPSRARSGILKVSKHSERPKGGNEAGNSKTDQPTASASDNTMPPSAKESESVVATAPVSVAPEQSEELSRESPMTSIENPTTASLENSATGFDKSERTEINEDFMAEEVESSNLSTQSQTENTIPIVIEPPEPKSESQNGESVSEGSSLKPRISFSSILPTKIIEIPSKEETKAMADDAPEDVIEHNELRKEAVKSANQSWFGTEQVGESRRNVEDGFEQEALDTKQEENDEVEYNEATVEMEDNTEDEGEEDQVKESNVQEVNDLLSEYSNDNKCEEEVHRGNEQEDEQGTCSEMSNLQVPNTIQQSSLANPNLAQPTPLEKISPKDVLDFNESPTDMGHNSELASQYKDEEGHQTDERFAEENADDNLEETVQELSQEDNIEPEMEHHESKTNTTEYPNQTASETLSPPSTLQHATDSAWLSLQLTNQVATVGKTMSEQPKNQDMETSETDRNTPELVFGTIAVEFSNQPLFYSPNFGAQGMNPIDHNGQENITEEESQRPYISIYTEMRNLLSPNRTSVGTEEVDDCVMARVTEVSDEGQNTGEQLQQPEEPGQSPPSLEVEDEFEQNSSRNPQEEEKELKRE